MVFELTPDEAIELANILLVSGVLVKDDERPGSYDYVTALRTSPEPLRIRISKDAR